MCKVAIKTGDRFMEIHEDNKLVTETIDSLAENVVKYMTEHRLTLSASESCTGGLFAAAVTAVPGASNVFHGGAVTYTEEMKVKLLGVSSETLRRYTVYSAETAREMSAGAARVFETDYAAAVTGIAGPAGGTAEKPVGTVYVSVRGLHNEVTRDLMLYNENGYEKLDRREIRRLTVARMLQMLSEMLLSDGGAIEKRKD